MSGISGGKKAILAAFFANLGIAAAKFTAWLFTGAASMLAEAIHSVADTSNQGLLLLGGYLARRRADPEHPFGYGRERYFWAFVVAMVIFALGAVFSVYEGVSKLLHPHDVESMEWAIGVLLVAIIFEGASLRTAVREARPFLAGRGWVRFVRESRAPELPVVLLEDTGALVGLVLALVGIGLSWLTKDSRFDAMGSLAIGVLLGVIAVVLAAEMRSLLIGESALPAKQKAIREAILSHPCVERLIHMRTEHIGPERLLVGAKVELERNLSFEQVAKVINEVEARIRETVPIAAVIYLEPDLFRPELVQGTRGGQPCETVKKEPGD